MDRAELVTYLDDYLRVGEIKDYGPQGLQVESDNDVINKIALAVDVAPHIIEDCAAWGADMLLVHHGILWRSVEKIEGALGARVRAFMRTGVNLYAAHLPLDAHTEVGNNAQLAQLLGLTDVEWWGAPTGTPLGVIGSVPNRPKLTDIVATVDSGLNTSSRVLAHGAERVTRMAVLSGFGADRVGEVKALGADCYLTGEMSHANFYAASDHGLNVIFAGHYATETVGVKALGQHLSKKFGLETRFFDYPTQM